MIAATEDKAIYTFWKGRTALYAILKAMDLGPGDVVLLPGYTCMVVPSAVMFLGAVPIYADVDAASYNVNQETLEAAWRKHSGLRPKAIIIQHTYGIPVEAAPIIHWARDEGLVVIEDCAHVVSSRYHEKACGSLGDAAFFSSQWSKPICTGLGGWGVANNPALADRLRRVRESFLPPDLGEVTWLRLLLYAHAILFRPRLFWPLINLYRRLSNWGVVIGSSSPEELSLAMPSRYAKTMSSMQERLLRRKLARAAANIDHRQRLAALYRQELARAGFSWPLIPPDSVATFVRYPVRVKNKLALLTAAQQRYLEMGDWFVSPLHPLTDSLEKLAYIQGSCPVAEELCRTTVNLPTHPKVTYREASKLLTTVTTVGEPI